MGSPDYIGLVGRSFRGQSVEELKRVDCTKTRLRLYHGAPLVARHSGNTVWTWQPLDTERIHSGNWQ